MAADTKTRLLDCAERLFSENGISATSLRAITTMAGANVAAVNYHFGSKEELVRSVLDRRLRHLAEERLAMLEACGDVEPGNAEDLAAVLRAMVVPFFRLLDDADARGDVFPRFLGRAHFEADPRLHEIFLKSFRSTTVAFLQKLGPSLPDLSREELFSRLLFTVGTLTTSINRRMFSDAADEDDVFGLAAVDSDVLVDELVAFLRAGFSAPPTQQPATVREESVDSSRASGDAPPTSIRAASVGGGDR